MTKTVLTRRNTYYDSVTLMLASRDAEAVTGVEFAAAITATPVNLELLAGRGFELAGGLGPNDLVVAISAENDSAAQEAARLVELALNPAPAEPSGPAGSVAPRSVRAAARSDPRLNVAFISVPGRFAAYEAAAALEAGLNVFCFSDGISLADEAELKRRAVDVGLLFMGADCGTAVIDGIAFGFANALRRGPVGIVGAAGTGIQQVTCLLDPAGVGISQAIGVGGRDLSADVGGSMSLRALDLLSGDDATELIAMVSKPSDPEVAQRIAAAAAGAGKPVVLGLLGAGGWDPPSGVELRTSLEEVAAACAQLCGTSLELEDAPLPPNRTPGEIRGFFCGGSLCEEAAQIVRRRDPSALFVDYGADEYTEGRAHPMIDPSLRNSRLESDGRDARVGAVVVDVVLGYGAHSDPARELAPLIERVIEARNHTLSVVVALCGTIGDPQDLAAQEKALAAAGAFVTHNAAHAARMAVSATGRAL